jgi:hypothetical protein
VISSTTTSIAEVAGRGARYADLQNNDPFLLHVQAVESHLLRKRLVQSWFENICVFRAELFCAPLSAFLS